MQGVGRAARAHNGKMPRRRPQEGRALSALLFDCASMPRLRRLLRQGLRKENLPDGLVRLAQKGADAAHAHEAVVIALKDFLQAFAREVSAICEVRQKKRANEHDVEVAHEALAKSYERNEFGLPRTVRPDALRYRSCEAHETDYCLHLPMAAFRAAAEAAMRDAASALPLSLTEGGARAFQAFAELYASRLFARAALACLHRGARALKSADVKMAVASHSAFHARRLLADLATKHVQRTDAAALRPKAAKSAAVKMPAQSPRSDEDDERLLLLPAPIRDDVSGLLYWRQQDANSCGPCALNNVVQQELARHRVHSVKGWWKTSAFESYLSSTTLQPGDEHLPSGTDLARGRNAAVPAHQHLVITDLRRIAADDWPLYVSSRRFLGFIYCTGGNHWQAVRRGPNKTWWNLNSMARPDERRGVTHKGEEGVRAILATIRKRDDPKERVVVAVGSAVPPGGTCLTHESRRNFFGLTRLRKDDDALSRFTLRVRRDAVHE